MDKPFTALYRTALQHRATFPGDMIYAPKSLCGAGIQRLTDLTHKEKVASCFG